MRRKLPLVGLLAVVPLAIHAPPAAAQPDGRGQVNGVNGGDQVRLTAGLRRPAPGHRARRARTTLTVNYKRRAVLVGRLVNVAGQPVIGARLAIAVAVDRGTPQWVDQPVNVVTDAGGAYKLIVAPGPSRRVRVSYYAYVLDTVPAQRRDVRLKVRARASLTVRSRTVPSGGRAVFSGQLFGTFRPPGVHVHLQARRGGGWQEIATSTTRPNGRFRMAYRFSGGARGRYVFRARIRHSPLFPYFLGYSRRISVRVV